jgi:hypothetical protein
VDLRAQPQIHEDSQWGSLSYIHSLLLSLRKGSIPKNSIKTIKCYLDIVVIFLILSFVGCFYWTWVNIPKLRDGPHLETIARAPKWT